VEPQDTLLQLLPLSPVKVVISRASVKT